METQLNNRKSLDVWYSLQSDYCYFLIDRLLALPSKGVDIVVRPVLGLVLRMPELTENRSELEQQYFLTDSQRTAEFLGIPYKYPDPSPIQFEPGSLWVASSEQPRIDRLYRLFVGANHAGKGLGFLDAVVRGLWNGTQPDWDRSSFLHDAMSGIGLDHDKVLADTTWPCAEKALDANHRAMLEVGHWGVPLMAYEGEPFYGQDRFDQLLWRMGVEL